MIVNFEFLDEDAFENVVTFMNYKVDKAVFFGYFAAIQKQKEMTERFLKNRCGVKEVVFHAVSQTDIQSTISTMRKVVEYELSCDNKLFFDITGGESLILVAFGMLATEFDLPVHGYDIEKDKLFELDCGNGRKTIGLEKKENEPLTLDMAIEMHGGVINRTISGAICEKPNAEFCDSVEKIYNVITNNRSLWNPFSDTIRGKIANVTGLKCCLEMNALEDALKKSQTLLNSLDKFESIVNELCKAGILVDIEKNDDYFCFTYASEDIKNCICKGGEALEIHTFCEESEHSYECMTGVHIDWDGVVHESLGQDVSNEIDVLSVEGNILHFISCKGGKLDKMPALNALYELETVARRFGGKYAKKTLIALQGLSENYMERAKEMGIEVRRK